jgi:hypothetical protein
MKVGKDGKLKLSKDERQIGNFIFKNEAEHVKISDINSQMTHRISKSLNIGKMIEMGLNDKQDVWLSNYAALTWLYSNIITDEQFFLDIDKACSECINRHKDFYGIKEDISEDADMEILSEVQGMTIAEEKFKNLEELKEKF